MSFLPSRFAEVILTFAPLFLQQRTWNHAGMLLIGAILAPGQRTVTSLLRIMGLSGERRFVNDHRVLNRAVWSSRAASRLLLGLLSTTLMPAGPVVLGLDDTIERRRGKRISAKGIYRDPVRSSKAFFVKTSGLRWLSLMLLAPVPWAGRVWALPFLTALAPSERCCWECGRRHKTLTDWARQVALQARPRLPRRGVGGLAAPPLAARGGVGADRRQRFGGPGTPGGAAPPRRNLYHAPAPRCCPLRTSPAPQARDARAAPDQGPAPGEPLRGADRHGYAMAAHHGAELVWRGRAHRRDPLLHRRLAPCWAAHRAHPRGAPPRPPGPLRPTGPPLHRPHPRSVADPDLVRPALAGGSHLPGRA